MKTMRNLLRVSVATVLSFAAMQILPWLRALDCNDCALKYGFPFSFRQTEGFATAPRFLWSGLMGDLLVAIALGVALMWAVRLARIPKSL
jgi:hypothetical protein